MIQKPSIPKGTRDFSPVEMARRNYIFSTIRSTYELFGYQPIETPALENLSTLLGKYGEEGDKLLFKILNSGDFASKTKSGFKTVNELDSNGFSLEISEKGLRYDLTVPFARYVVQNRNEITFPFKRYQIQTVWRADRPQRGRYREFYQCDADVIGSNSLLNELELIQIIDHVFTQLGVNVQIKLNNRKILAGIAEYIGQPDKFIDITVAIDKIDKIGKEKVVEELVNCGLSLSEIEKLNPIFELSGTVEEKINSLKQLLTNESGISGINEISEIFNYLKTIEIKNEVVLDLTLARGLNYYTGAIIEVAAKDIQIGSICGGGRYDDLTGIFGLPDVSGVGISFGADRIYDVLNELNLFPAETGTTSKVLFINFGKKEEEYCLPILAKLRLNNIKSEIYPDAAKLKKQFTYADNKQIPYVVIAGEEEMKNNIFTLRNMKTGEQEQVSAENLLGMLKG